MSKSPSLTYLERVAYDSSMMKGFWEKIIEIHTKQQQSEDARIQRSALDR